MGGFTNMLAGVQAQLDKNEPKVALDLVFGQNRHLLATFNPSKEETTHFLVVLGKAIVAENKADHASRLQALLAVHAYNDNPGGAHFTGVSPSRFAFQLALRIREPNLISQGDLGLCGANAAVIHFAKNNPKSYAQLGIDLMKTGRGVFGQKQIEPNANLKSGVQQLRLDPADYVILASVRGAAGWIDWLSFNSKKGIAEGQIPEEVCALLKEAGYTDVENNVYTILPTNWVENLQKAAQCVSLGRLVIISINGDLVDVMLGDKIRKVTALPLTNEAEGLIKAKAARGSGVGHVTPAEKGMFSRTDHWVLVSKLTVTDDEVTIKLYSWGESLKRTMPRKNFLTYYGGYISAKLGGETMGAPKPMIMEK